MNIFFYPNSHNDSVDKIKISIKVLLERGKKPKIVAFLKRMRLFSLTVQLKIRVLIVLADEGREKSFVMDNPSLRQSNERIPELKYRYLDPFHQIVFQAYPHSALLSSSLLRAVKPESIG